MCIEFYFKYKFGVKYLNRRKLKFVFELLTHMHQRNNLKSAKYMLED